MVNEFCIVMQRPFRQLLNTLCDYIFIKLTSIELNEIFLNYYLHKCLQLQITLQLNSIFILCKYFEKIFIEFYVDFYIYLIIVVD